VATLTEDLATVIARVRAAAADAGELTPRRRGPIRARLPERVRDAIAEDLASGAYHRAAQDAVTGDPELAQD
jgi:hypothetical protein